MHNKIQFHQADLELSPILDNPRAVKYDSSYYATAANDGNGLSNNRPYTGSSEILSTVARGQNASATNIAPQHKISRYLDTTTAGAAGKNVLDTLLTKTHLTNEFRPYYDVNSNYMIWYDYAVIKLNHLFES